MRITPMPKQSSLRASRAAEHALAPIPEELFHACTRSWFSESFACPTRVQLESWPALYRGDSALLLAPTGSGKTLAAFLAAIDRLVFSGARGESAAEPGIKVVYISPLKALGVDVDRNLRAPLAGISAVAARECVPHRDVRVAIRSSATTWR